MWLQGTCPLNLTCLWGFAHAAAYGRGIPATGRQAYGAVAPPAAPPVAAAGALGAGRGALSAYTAPVAAGEYARHAI